jgi:hypothetical protein
MVFALIRRRPRFSENPCQAFRNMTDIAAYLAILTGIEGSLEFRSSDLGSGGDTQL